MGKVILDSDGVLSDFAGHLLAELRARGFQVPETFVTYEIFDHLDERAQNESKMLMREGAFWNEIPKYDDAVAMVEALKRDGHDILVLTTPWPTCLEWDFCRRAWLMRNFGLHPKRMFSCHEKHHVPGDVFVDDKPANVATWKKSWPESQAYLMNRPWNEREEGAWDRISWDQEGIDRLLSAARGSSSATSGR